MNGFASLLRRESNEISRFWIYPRMQIEKSERSKRDIAASRENAASSNKTASAFHLFRCLFAIKSAYNAIVVTDDALPRAKMLIMHEK